MSAQELDSWELFWQVEPWGSYRDNIHAGIIASAVLAPHVQRGKKAPIYTDFLLRDKAETQQAAENNLLAFFKSVAKKREK